jgi:hypothetical protein
MRLGAASPPSRHNEPAWLGRRFPVALGLPRLRAEARNDEPNGHQLSSDLARCQARPRPQVWFAREGTGEGSPCTSPARCREVEPEALAPAFGAPNAMGSAPTYF